jgi:hypothetical protein
MPIDAPVPRELPRLGRFNPADWKKLAACHVEGFHEAYLHRTSSAYDHDQLYLLYRLSKKTRRVIKMEVRWQWVWQPMGKWPERDVVKAYAFFGNDDKCSDKTYLLMRRMADGRVEPQITHVREALSQPGLGWVGIAQIRKALDHRVCLFRFDESVWHCQGQVELHGFMYPAIPARLRPPMLPDSLTYGEAAWAALNRWRNPPVWEESVVKMNQAIHWLPDEQKTPEQVAA